MKMLLFVSALVFSTVSFANERVFDCKATQVSTDLELSEDINIAKNPYVLFIQGKKDWTLSVGDVTLSTMDLKGPDLEMEEGGGETSDEVRYDFWVERSYEYQVNINVVDHTATVYWWGLGEAIEVGRFQCEVSEK